MVWASVDKAEPVLYRANQTIGQHRSASPGRPGRPSEGSVELNRRTAAWRLTLLVHGEQGAMLVCSPLVFAHLAWDLHEASRGRFVLGLGTQVKAHVERLYSVPWEAPGPRLRDAILAIRAIWRCWQERSSLEYRGRFYTFTLMTPAFSPEPLGTLPPRIYISAVNRYHCRLVGELCDGVHVHPFHSPRDLRPNR